MGCRPHADLQHREQFAAEVFCGLASKQLGHGAAPNAATAASCDLQSTSQPHELVAVVHKEARCSSSAAAVVRSLALLLGSGTRRRDSGAIGLVFRRILGALDGQRLALCPPWRQRGSLLRRRGWRRGEIVGSRGCCRRRRRRRRRNPSNARVLRRRRRRWRRWRQWRARRRIRQDVRFGNVVVVVVAKAGLTHERRRCG